jgi:hypothetical protein
MPFVYDLESFPNFFSMCIKPVSQPGFFFEVSDRRRDNTAMWRYIAACDSMIGFNVMGYDWPMLQHFLEHPDIDAAGMYEKSMAIIGGDRYEHVIWQPAIPQIDLYLIHHFNNRAKSTSLKKLQFNMRARNVMDCPIPFGVHLNYEEMDVVLGYNAHDVTETEQFYHASADKIALRQAINPDWINQSDTGLGRKYFECELQALGVTTHARDETGRRKALGTPRPEGVRLADIIFPYIHFRRPELVAALDTFRRVHVPTQDFEGELPWVAGSDKVYGVVDGAIWRKHEFSLDSVPTVIGLGGIHASLDRKLIVSDDHHTIVDLDVTSFYPNIAIKNRIFPLHLGPAFCDVYASLLERRLRSAKGSPENQALKLALNSVFGSAGSAFTCFYDPAWMLAVTINGQLLILKLAEMLLDIPGVRLIQLNTDGITVACPNEHLDRLNAKAAEWTAGCAMPLERNTYSRMWIRDVNNYLAEYAEMGKVKRKGAYNAEREWHQNQSMPVIREAAEAAMVRGMEVERFIADAAAQPGGSWDFMMRLDLNKASVLRLDDGTSQRGIVRYYVSPTGAAGVKHMPSTTTRIHARGHAEVVGKRGMWCCTACGSTHKTKKAWELHADAEHASKLRLAQVYDGEPIDYDMRFYAAEAKKLIITDRFYP